MTDKRLCQVTHRRTPVDEVLKLVDRYRSRHEDWYAKYFYVWYCRDGSGRGYTWVKNQLQEARRVPIASKRVAYRKRREHSPWPGIMVHQDGSTHELGAGVTLGFDRHACPTIVEVMDDATNEHYSMFFVEEEGTHSSFRGVREVIEARGLFHSPRLPCQ